MTTFLKKMWLKKKKWKVQAEDVCLQFWQSLPFPLLNTCIAKQRRKRRALKKGRSSSYAFSTFLPWEAILWGPIQLSQPALSLQWGWTASPQPTHTPSPACLLILAILPIQLSVQEPLENNILNHHTETPGTGTHTKEQCRIIGEGRQISRSQTRRNGR